MSIYLPKENEIQRIYSELGLAVPVGDLSTTKAPAIKPLSSSSTQTSITTQFNVMSGADITSLSYKVNDGESVSVTPQKGVVTITLSDLEYNSGPYEIELTATNETGSTSTSNTVDLQHYTNWATPDEVLLGNKYIGEDGQETVGTYVPSEGPTDGGAVVTSATLEYQIIQDPDAGEFVNSIIRVNFDTFPAMDFDNHMYMATLYADSEENMCQDYIPVGCRLSSVDCGYSMEIRSNILEDGYIELGGSTFPVEVENPGEPTQTAVPLDEVDAYLVIYEDKMWNQKYIIPITLTCTQVTEL